MKVADHGRQWVITVDDFEFHDLHHALRMLLKHPMTPRGEEFERLTASADTLWTAHCHRGEHNTDTRSE